MGFDLAFPGRFTDLAPQKCEPSALEGEKPGLVLQRRIPPAEIWNRQGNDLRSRLARSDKTQMWAHQDSVASLLEPVALRQLANRSLKPIGFSCSRFGKPPFPPPPLPQVRVLVPKANRACRYEHARFAFFSGRTRTRTWNRQGISLVL